MADERGHGHEASEGIWPVTRRIEPGLGDAVVATTRVGDIGERGTLLLRGIPIEALAGRATFEEVACLLVEGVHARAEPERFRTLREELCAGREPPSEVEAILGALPRDTHPTRLLRAGVSAAGCFDLDPEPATDPTGRRRALRLIGLVAALAGLIARHRRGLPALPIRPDSSIAEALAQSLRDGEPDAEAQGALDLCLVLYAENGMDAPTFTSLVVGSARADPSYTAIAGLSALHGPRVGGVGEVVLRELLALEDAAAARAWVRRRLDAGERIPGFGHRVFRAPDPRVPILRERAGRLAARRGGLRLFDVARAVEGEAEVLAARGVHPNVNLYSAVVFHLLGAPPELVPCLVGVGRMAGIVARTREYLAQNRILRPLLRYVGRPPRPFVALGDR